MKAAVMGIESNKTLDVHLSSRRETKEIDELLAQKKIPNSYDGTAFLADTGL